MKSLSATQIFFAQLANNVVRPTLARLGFNDGPIGLNLLLGTAAQESGGAYLAQRPTGPALGLWQIEPATHQDVLTNFAAFWPALMTTLAGFAAATPPRDLQLASNLAYACAVARLIYHRASAPLPASFDPALLGANWKQHYNTAGGGGSVDEFVGNFALRVAGQQVAVIGGPSACQIARHFVPKFAARYSHPGFPPARE